MKNTSRSFPGDGIGPEIVTEAVKVLDASRRRTTATAFTMTKVDAGGCAIDRYGELPAAGEPG